jgi:hypothetical protein
MSSIRILDEGSLPEVDIMGDIGQTIDIGSIDSLDISLLANQKKLSSPPRQIAIGGGNSPTIDIGSAGEIKADDIELVNLDDVSYNVKSVAPSGGDSIKIVRDFPMADAQPIMAPKPTPFTPPPAPVQSSAGAGGMFDKVKSLFGSGAASVPQTSESASSGGFRNWFSGGAGGDAGPTESAPVPRMSEYLTPEQEFVKKTEALTMLERMEKRGIVGNKMTMANSLDEIQAEVERRKDSKALEASIRFQRSMLTTVTNGMEFLNSRFDPLGVKLDGWSEQVNENIEDYDEIFEELYDKYKDKSKVAPEVRLIMSLGLSAAMCHVTNTMFKSKMPGMDDILRNNPDLARQFAQAAANQVGPGFGNFVSMGMPGGSGGSNGSSRRQSMQQPPSMGGLGGMFGGGGGGLGGMFGSMFGGGGPPSPPQMSQSAPMYDPAPPSNAPGTATARREMRGPSGVEDILRTLNAAGEMPPNRSVPPPASPQLDVEEIGSVRSGFTTETARMAGRSRRKPSTAQPVGATLTLNV